MQDMTRTLLVTLGETLDMPRPFNRKNIPQQKTPAEMALFFEHHKDEIAFVESILKDAPAGTKLRSHHHERRLIYKNTATDESVTLHHTYVKTADGIAVQTERGDINIVGYGGFGKVKRMYTIPNNNTAHQPPAIVIKTCINDPLMPPNLDTALTSISISTERPSNPFKSAKGETGFVLRPLWHQSALSVKFDATEFNKEQPRTKLTNTELSKTSEGIKKSTRKPQLEFSPYLPMTLRQFIKCSILSNDATLHFIHSLLKTMDEASRQKIVHRDLKPENILVDPTTKSAQVIDWGVALQIPSDKDYVLANCMGTMEYFPYELAFLIERYYKNKKIPEGEAKLSTLFPFLHYAKMEVPNDYMYKGSGQCHYSARYDIYTLGLCIREMATTTNPPIADTIKALTSLMTCYHPEGRPTLILIRLAFFSLLWDEKQTSHGLAKTDTADFSTALAQAGLPNLSVEMIHAIKDILVITADIFKIAQIRSLDTIPRHEPNQWTLLLEINTRLNRLIESNSTLEAFTLLQSILTFCKNTTFCKTRAIEDTIQKIRVLETKPFYRSSLLSSDHPTIKEAHSYLDDCIVMFEKIFGNDPNQEKLIPHCLALFKKIKVSAKKVSEFVKAAANPEFAAALKILFLQHYKECIESPTKQNSPLWPCIFQTPANETSPDPKQYSQKIEAAFTRPFFSIEDETETLHAIAEEIKHANDMQVAPSLPLMEYNR